MIANSTAGVIRQDSNLVDRLLAVTGVQAVGRQLIGTGRMEPVQFSLCADAGLIEVNHRAGKNRLTDVLLGRFQMLKTSCISSVKCSLADRA